MDDFIVNIESLMGHGELEQRYVKTGPGELECQGRSKRFDRHGVCVEITPWVAISRVENVPDEFMVGLIVTGHP